MHSEGMPSQVAEVADSSRVKIGYVVELRYDVAASTEFVFKVHAARTPQQRVVAESFVVEPDAPVTVEEELPVGNRIARLSSAAGPLRVRYSGTVVISHVTADPDEVTAVPLAQLPASTLPFLLPSRYCQVDHVTSLAWREFGHVTPGYAQVGAVCDWVRERTRFQPGASGTNTSALETLNDGIGVCRDFAHLTISLLRALNYPARIVTGVDYGADPGLGPPDFHAYVEAYLGGRWFLFDPTAISPLTGLIRIATGRDAADVSFATMFGQVQSGMPQVAFAAAEDVAAGIALPLHTRLAVSTAEE
jgi:transglutaminase-like putative cysteine protease